MTSMELVGLNTKWYRYQNNLTQEQYANKTKFKMAYISVIETGNMQIKQNLKWLILVLLKLGMLI